VIGVYLHDLFKDTAYRQWWLSMLGWRGEAQDWSARMEAELDRIARVVAQHWDSLRHLPTLKHADAPAPS